MGIDGPSIKLKFRDKKVMQYIIKFIKLTWNFH